MGFKLIFLLLITSFLVDDGIGQNLLTKLKNTPWPVSEFYKLVLRSNDFKKSFNTTNSNFWTVFVPPNSKLKEYLANKTNVDQILWQYTYLSTKDGMLTIQYLNTGSFVGAPIQGYSGTNYGRGSYIVVARSSSGSLFIFQQKSVTGINKYYVNNAQFVPGAANNFATNGVFHLITDILVPLGTDSKINTFLTSNVSQYSTMNTMLNSFTQQPDITAISQNFLDPSTGSRTYFITPNSAWAKVPASEMKKINSNHNRRWKIIFDHLIPNQIIYTSALTKLTSVQVGSWKLPNDPLNFNNYVPPTRFFYRDRKGNNFVEVDFVTSLITYPNTPITSALVHLVDWPVGVKYGYFNDVLNNTLYKVNSFRTVCTSNTFCSGIIGTSPKPAFNTLFAPQGYPATTSPNSNAVTRILKMHVVPKFQLTSRQLRFDSITHNSTDVTARIRQNFDLSNHTYIEARPWNSTRGYVSARLMFADKTKLTGVVQIISRPFGFYNYTMEQYMRTRLDLYSTYLPYYKQINAQLLKSKTVFAPTNAAFSTMKIDTFNNGKEIFLNPYTRSWVLRTMVLENVKLMLEDKAVAFSKAYRSLNTQYDLYNPVIRVIKSTAIGGKTGQLWMKSTSINIVIHTGGIEASDGIIYPVNKVLYNSADIDPPCISKKCQASLRSPKFINLLIALIVIHFLKKVISS